MGVAMLKHLYPTTPIAAFAATGSNVVFRDIVNILHLGETTPGSLAEPGKAVFFSAPLHRPNLRYSVRLKPVEAKTLARLMTETIVIYYPDSTGIVYCPSDEEAEELGKLLQAQYSRDKVGIYHDEMGAPQKRKVLEDWKGGRVKCMVATPSFASE